MGKPKNGKKPADSVQSAAPAQGAEPKAEKEYKDNSFKLGLKHTGAAALEVGALVVTEKPVMKIILKSDEPSQAELQQWGVCHDPRRGHLALHGSRGSAV